jgi:hypothetical protein
MDCRIRYHVKELQNALITAGVNYGIWWIYKNKETRKKLVEPLTLYYPTSIGTSQNAHFVAMIIAAYRVFETRRDTVNLPNLLRLIEKEGVVGEDEILRFKAKMNRTKKAWVNISIIRNRLFAHRSNDLDAKEIWEEADLTPNKLQSFIEDSKQLLNEITIARDNSGHAFSQSAIEDTVSMFEDLNAIDREWT